VIGTTEDIPLIVKDDEIDEIIIAIPSATGEQIRRITEICRNAGVDFKIIPGVGDLIGGKISVSTIREVQIEDLLGRNPVNLNIKEIASYLENKSILITGAGGSIGSEVARQVARYNPSLLTILDIAETPLFYIENQLKSMVPNLNLHGIIADVKIMRD